MRTFKKSLIALLLAFCLAFIAACSGSQNTGSNQPRPVDILPKLEAAYNSQDLYAVVECFEPSVKDFAFGILNLFGVNGDAFKQIMPFASKMLGSSGLLDQGNWGRAKLSEVSTAIIGDTATLVYNVQITPDGGEVSDFNDTIQMVKIDDQWYIAAIQMPGNTETNNNNTENNNSSTDGEFVKFTDDCYPLQRNGKWGVVNENGDVIVDFTYEHANAKIYPNGYWRIQNQSAWACVDAKNNIIYALDYEAFGEYSEGYAAVKKGGLWGFIDNDGVLVVPCAYEEVSSFSEGLCAVKKDGFWGFIDGKDNVDIEFLYDNVGLMNDNKYDRRFQNGATGVYINKAVGVIDKAGKYLTSLNKDIIGVSYTQVDYYILQVTPDEKYSNLNWHDRPTYAFINSKNSRIRDDIEDICYSDENILMANVVDKNGKVSFEKIDKSGKTLKRYTNFEGVPVDTNISNIVEIYRAGDGPSENYVYNYINVKNDKIISGKWVADREKSILNEHIIVRDNNTIHIYNSKGDLIKKLNGDYSLVKDSYLHNDNNLITLDPYKEYNLHSFSTFVPTIKAAIVKDNNDVFYGLYVKDKLAYPCEYTSINYDEKEQIFTLKKGATTTRVFVAKNGNIIEP
jgi:hypothetical protein